MEIKNRFIIPMLSCSLSLVACGGAYDNDPVASNPPIDDEPEPVQLQAINPELGDTAIGSVWSNDKGLTLYTFEQDRLDRDGDGYGDSDCNNTCADTWPPLIASADASPSGDFTLITRDDGSTRQWAFNGLPLYRFSSDEAPGDALGEGIGETWYVARPFPFALGDVDASAKGRLILGYLSVMRGDAQGIASERMERSGFALYTFETDREDTVDDGSNDSVCDESCAESWPPLLADKGATAKGFYSIIVRNDGLRQWAYKGMPLYFFSGDQEPSTTNGEGIGDVWYVARPHPFKTATSSLGSIFVAATSIAEIDEQGKLDSGSRSREGFSLYFFDKDLSDSDGDGLGDSDCNGTCAVNWPPVFADFGATPIGNYTLIERDDGAKQWAFKGQPLYFFANDQEAGDTNGDGLGQVFHLARSAPVQLFEHPELGKIFSARGSIYDVDNSGKRASTRSDKSSFTLYRFTDDANDVEQDGSKDSDCNDSCAATWPPLYAAVNDTASGDFSIIDRADGSKQWAYKDAPLYFFSGDTLPEQSLGVYGTWHEVRP